MQIFFMPTWKGRGLPHPSKDPIARLWAGDECLEGEERVILRQWWERLDANFAAGGYLTGLRPAGQILPYAIFRSTGLDVSIPEWAWEAVKNPRRRGFVRHRVFDVEALFRRNSHETGWTIQDEEVSSVFGQENFTLGDMRKKDIEFPKSWSRILGCAGFGKPFPALDEDIADEMEMPFAKIARVDFPSSNISWFSWIVAPLKKSIANGFAGNFGWNGVRAEKQARLPWDEGRWHPGMQKITGFVACTAKGWECQQIPDNEGKCIDAGLNWLESHRMNSRVFVEDSMSFRGFTLLRAARRGSVLPGWFLSLDQRDWLQDLQQTVSPLESHEDARRELTWFAQGTGYGATPLKPVFSLAFSQEYLEKLSMVCRNYIVSSPFVPRMEESPHRL